MRHIPSLDGVRAIAVLMVMLFHSSCLRGGFIGVDIFFVLSGFLITSLFITEYEQTGSISIRNFLARRFLRLAPALWFCVACYLSIAWLLDPSWAYRLELRSALTALIYVKNYTLGGRDIFVHTWSLAVEEQFYLIWVVVVLFLVVLNRRRAAAILGGTVTLIYLGRAISLWIGAPVLALHVRFESRADALLVGGATAFLLAQYDIRARVIVALRKHRYIGLLCLAALCALGLVAQPLTPAEPLLWMPAVALASAILLTELALNESGFATRVLAWPPLVAIGGVSYGVYLWHDPVHYFLRDYGFDAPLTHLVVSAIFGFGGGALSWRYVEAPALRLKRRFQPLMPRLRMQEADARLRGRGNGRAVSDSSRRAVMDSARSEADAVTPRRFLDPLDRSGDQGQHSAPGLIWQRPARRTL